MAGDWIKMRGNLWDDPRVAKLVDLTDSTEAAVVGALYWLWATADQHTEDGIMPGLSLRQIDRKTGVKGFGDALCAVGWLADHPDGVRVVDFEKHNGASAKKRCQTAKRVANHESANAGLTPVDAKTNAPSVSGALAREEIEKEIDTKKEGESAPAKAVAPPKVAKPDDVDEQVWADWLQLRKTKKAPVTLTVLDGAQSEAAKAGMSLEDFLRVWCRRGSQGLEAAWLKPDERQTFAQVKADVAKVTVTENPDVEATKARARAEAQLQRNGPSLDVLARLAALRGQSTQATKETA